VKRYRFRLGAVLRVRRVAEDQAKGRLADANRTVRDAEGSLEARRRAYEALEPARRQLTARQFHEEVELRRSVALSLITARQALDDARDAAELRRQELVRARQDTEALERMEERRRAEHVAEVRRAEERLVDDIVTARAERRAADEERAP
jgi:flagellar export protein FliJ